MKLRSLAATLIVGMLALTGVSCDYEPIDPAVSIAPQNPGGPNNPGDPGNPGGPSEGDYWPAALNNTWNYVRGTENFQMKIISINAINGHTYYTFNEQLGSSSGGMNASAVTRMRKSGGDYHEKLDDVTIQPTGPIPGGTITGFEFITLKDNVGVGSTWNQNVTQTTTYNDPIIPTLTTNLAITGKILEKGGTATVQGQTYEDVIKVEISLTMSMAGLPAGPGAVTNYWFAKDVGPIKAVTVETGGETYTTELVSYSLN